MLKACTSYICQNRIEKYYHNDRAINFLSRSTTYQNTGWEKKNAFVIFVLQYINSNLLDKNRTQEKVKCHIQHEGCWTGKLQVTLFFAFISLKKFCSHTFKASSVELIVEVKRGSHLTLNTIRVLEKNVLTFCLHKAPIKCRVSIRKSSL